MTDRERLINEIDAFLAKTGMKPTRLGMDALGDPSFVKRLRLGRRVFEDTAAAVRAWMKAYKPPRPRRPMRPKRRAQPALAA